MERKAGKENPHSKSPEGF